MGTPAGRSTPPSTLSTSVPRTVRGDGRSIPAGSAAPFPCWGRASGDGGGDGMGMGIMTVTGMGMEMVTRMVTAVGMVTVLAWCPLAPQCTCLMSGRCRGRRSR